MSRRALMLILVLGAAVATAARTAPARADGLARVTGYFCPPFCGATASGSLVQYGLTAGCSAIHMGQDVDLIDPDSGRLVLTRQCLDTGACWWFEDECGGDSNRVDVFGWAPYRDYFIVQFR